MWSGQGKIDIGDFMDIRIDVYGIHVHVLPDMY